MAAAYVARDGPWHAWDKEIGAYDEKVTGYDANGNIQGLERYTKDNEAQRRGIMDKLQFSYAGNQLTWVDDHTSGDRGFRDRFEEVEYFHDANGNLTRDRNKEADYAYNALNKVERQTVGAGTITYTYDASGAVVRKKTTTTTAKTEYYVDGFVYEYSPSFTGLRSVPTPEGRALAVQQSDTKLTYEYHLRDHLGNLRVAFRAQATTQELKLSSEVNEPEGAYPKFSNIAPTRTPASGTPPDGTQVAAGHQLVARPLHQRPRVARRPRADSGLLPDAQRRAVLRHPPPRRPAGSAAGGPGAGPHGPCPIGVFPPRTGRPGTLVGAGRAANVTGLLSALTTKTFPSS
jgi:YD repeat-containing protein